MSITPNQIEEFWRVIDAKYARAHELDDAFGTWINLCGATGSIHAFSFRGVGIPRANIIWDRIGEHRVSIDIKASGARYVSPNESEDNPADWTVGRDTFQSLIDEINAMEVAPLDLVPYGFVANGEIIGIAFATERSLVPGDTERKGLGLTMDAYFAREPHLAIGLQPQPNLALWLADFWQRYQRGEVVNLSERIRNLRSDMWAIFEHTHWCIKFDSTDGQTPAFVDSHAYIARDIAAGWPSYDTRSAKPGDKTILNTWFN